MGILLNLLALPVLGGPMLVNRLAGIIAQQTIEEFMDEGRLRGELLELLGRYETGELADQEYQHEEEVLLERLAAAHEFQAQRRRSGLH